MGTTMSNDNRVIENFEEISENSDHEILNSELITAASDRQSNEVTDDNDRTSNNVKKDDHTDKIYCISLDGEPIFYLKDKTDDEVKNILKMYAKKICTRAQRHYPDLMFYIEEDDNLGIEITTVHKFVLMRYETTYCNLRCKQLSTIN